MRGQHISFCSFCSSCVLRDYYYRGRLHREKKRKTATREKRKNVCFPSPAVHHREKKFFFREILIIIIIFIEGGYIIN